MKNICTVPDTEEMTRDTFVKYLKLNAAAKRFGFSRKHTEDILHLREVNGYSIPDKVYGIPVEWNQDVTWFK